MTDRHRSDAVLAHRWLPPLLLLVGSATLISISPAFTPVNTADGSTALAAVGTAWLVAVPVLVAIVATGIRAELGIAAVVGAGAVAIGRLLADLGLVFSPDSVLRPELFGVRDVSAFPLTANWAAGLPLIADLLAVIAAGLAGRIVLDGYEPPRFGDGLARFDDTSLMGIAPAEGRPVAISDPMRSGPPLATGALGVATGPPGPVRPFRATPFTVLGLVAAGLLIGSSLGVPYASPVPVVRPLGVADIGLFAAAGAALNGLVLCLLVVVASVLPVASARGVVLGAGAASAMPGLTVLFAGGDVRASQLAWIGLLGAILLAAVSSLLRSPSRAASSAAGSDSGRASSTAAGALADVVPVPAWRSVILGLIGIGAAGCALLAYLKPQAASLLGAEGASFDAAGSGFLPAASVLLICGIAVLSPQISAPIAYWGRLGLGLAWVPAAAALLSSLEFTSSSIWVSTAVFTSSGGVERSTGAWWGVAAVGGAAIAAILAPLLSSKYRDSADAAADPEEVADRAAEVKRSVIGWALTGLVVVAYALPVYSAAGRSSSALFVGAARVDTYGAWLSVVALCAAVWLACRSRQRTAALGLLVAAAAVTACRIALLPAVRGQLEFKVLTGFYATGVLVVALLAAAAVLWRTIVAPQAAPRQQPRGQPGQPRRGQPQAGGRSGGSAKAGLPTGKARPAAVTPRGKR